MKPLLQLCRRLSCATVLGLLVVLTGCRADVDLEHIDTTAELDFGIAVPVGTMGITLGDMLGTQTSEYLFFDNGTLCFHREYTQKEDFHFVDFTEHISNAEKTIPLYEAVSAQMDAIREQFPMLDIPADVICGIPGQPQHLGIDAEILMEYAGINTEESDMRLDSAYITQAYVDGYLKAQDMPIPFSWVDTIRLDFGEEFMLNDGRSHVLYAKGDPNAPSDADYGTPFPIELKSFLLDLLKDHSLPPSTENVKNSSKMNVHVAFTVPAAEEGFEPIPIGRDMAVVYGMNVRFIDYEAVWGYFSASNKMVDEREVSMEAILPEWSRIKNTRLPLAAPKISMHVTHSLAGPLFMSGDYLYIRSESGEIRYAEFGDNHSHSMRYPNEEEMKDPSVWISTDISTLGESREFTIVFDSTAAHGNMDELFTIQPAFAGWKWSIDFDQSIAPQARLTPNTSVEMNVDVNVPFVFNKGLYISYKDTMENINLSSIHLDSLAGGYIDSIKSSDLYLNMKIENTLPADVRLIVQCIDANNALITDKATGKPLTLSKEDTILIKAPTFARGAEDEFTITAPGQATTALRLDKDKADYIEAIRGIVIEVVLDDQSLSPTFEQYGQDFKVRITDDSKLKLQLGVGAKAGVVANFDNLIQ